MKPALIIIYNHRYDRNIEIIEKIYHKRFSYIYHLVPFYDGDKVNVIPVYDNSFCFQGYVAQAFKHIDKENYTHYFFVADDMVLNPAINEDNFTEIFRLDAETCFIPELRNTPIAKNKYWYHHRDALHFRPFNKKAHNTRGVEISDMLPSKENAKKIMSQWGVQNTPLSFRNVYGNFFKKFIEKVSWLIEDIFVQFYVFYPRKTNYPLANAYSDIFIVAKSTMQKFTQYCGVMAAMRLFAEIAIPTALALSAKKIRTEKELKLQGRALWHYIKGDLETLNIYHNDLSVLLNNFPETYIYLHPIKLSKWNTQNL